MENSVAAAPSGVLSDVKRAAVGIRSALGISESFAVEEVAPVVLTAVAFAVLFAQPFIGLVKDWWTLPEAGHGLLLFPVSIWLAWKSGIRQGAAPNRSLGIAVLVFAVLVRSAAGLAAELFTMRASILIALVGLTIYGYGLRQVIHWWLPFLLGGLAIPLPELITQALALPLQFRASRMGAALLNWRSVPVRLEGNVIRVPGHELFVTEACSGLRSLTALLSVAVLMSAMVLRGAFARTLLVLLAIPIAIVVNGVRVFLTGFLVYFVDPALGQGFMHITEGWILFLVSMSLLGVVAWVELVVENRFRAWRHPAPKEVVDEEVAAEYSEEGEEGHTYG